ncbi:MAG: SCP2 sterol-binding domain-containing protein [bacterium]
MPLPNPPEGTSLSEYFESWLPGQLSGIRDVLKQKAPELHLKVGFRAEGEEGGDWSMIIKNGELSFQKGLSDDCMVIFILSDRDFQDVISGKRQMMPMGGQAKKGGEEIQPERLAKRLKKTAESVKEIKGMIEFAVKGEEEPDFSARINFGPLLDKPTVKIGLSEADMKAMQKGELNPQTAFMQGKMKIEGDFSFLLQLAPLMT